MRIKSVTVDKPLSLAAIDDRYFMLDEPRTISVETDEGRLDYKLYYGFQSNFRSGSNLIDCVIPHIGTSLIQLAYLIHDANYCLLPNGEHPLSKELSDKLLKAMLVYAGMSKFKAHVAYLAVKFFGDSAYDEVDKVTAWNVGKFSFNWSDK